MRVASVCWLQITEERIKEVVLAEDFRDLASMLQEVGCPIALLAYSCV